MAALLTKHSVVTTFKKTFKKTILVSEVSLKEKEACYLKLAVCIIVSHED